MERDRLSRIADEGVMRAGGRSLEFREALWREDREGPA